MNGFRFIPISLILAGIFLVAWRVWDKKPYDYWMIILIFILSAIEEITCVHYGAWTYANPNFFNIPLWIPIVYAIGLTNLIKMSHTMMQLTGRKIETPKINIPQELIFDAVIYILLVAFMALLWRHDYLATLFFVLLFIFVAYVWREEKSQLYVAYFVGLFLIFNLDLVCIPAGIWYYGKPSIFYIPFWLPFAYALGMVLAFRIGKVVTKLISE